MHHTYMNKNKFKHKMFKKKKKFWKRALIFANSFSPRFGNTPFLDSNTIETHDKILNGKLYIYIYIFNDS